MLMLVSGNLEKGRDLEYKNFIAKNLETFRKRAPPGCKLKGVYGATFNLGRYDVTWIWEFSKFSDLDAARNFSDPVADRLYADEADFYVPGSLNSVIMRDVREWNVLSPRKAKKRKK